LFGTAPDRQFVMAGGGYSYLCRVVRTTEFRYSVSVLPLALTIQPREHPSAPRAIYGFAATPFGITADFRRSKRIQPYGEVQLGIIASTSPIPFQRPNATGLNFVVAASGGVRWNLGARRALRVGYSLFHISNADTTAYNPGVDNNVIYISYSFLD
jgi:hypothetical protein